jgi:hypothetical protein
MRKNLHSLCAILLLAFCSQALAGKYSHIDFWRKVPRPLLKKTLAYFDANKSKIRNQNQIVIIDYSKHSMKERFFLIDMHSGKVKKYLVAHGKNSDTNHDGYATDFSNVPDSLKTSLGFYRTAETYYGKHGYSLKLDGLSSTNSNARVREIVIHGAEYVYPGAQVLGRSWGCPALDQNYSSEVIDQIKGGTLIYAGLKE